MFATSQLAQPERPLCTLLREQALTSRWAFERLLWLPSAIHKRDDYVIWLDRFLSLHDPLESLCAGFLEWGALGGTVPQRDCSDRIIADPGSFCANSAEVTGPHASSSRKHQHLRARLVPPMGWRAGR